MSAAFNSFGVKKKLNKKGRVQRSIIQTTCDSDNCVGRNKFSWKVRTLDKLQQRESKF